MPLVVPCSTFCTASMEDNKPHQVSLPAAQLGNWAMHVGTDKGMSSSLTLTCSAGALMWQ